MKYNFDFNKLREKGTCIRFNDENEYNIFIDWYNKNINEVSIIRTINYYKNICLVFCSIQSNNKFGHNEYGEYIEQHHPKIYTFDELLIKDEFKDYKPIKSISGKDIVNKACREEFEKFVKHFGFYNEIEFNEENFNWIRDNIENGIKFGIDNGLIEKVEKYDENKLYYCSSGCDTTYLSKLSKINDKFIWVSYRNSLFSNKYYSSIKESIEYIKSLGWDVNSFDTFEEAMEYYFPNKNKIDNMSKTDKINLLYDLCEEFEIDINCKDIGPICYEILCKDCKINKY